MLTVLLIGLCLMLSPIAIYLAIHLVRLIVEAIIRLCQAVAWLLKVLFWS